MTWKGQNIVYKDKIPTVKMWDEIQEYEIQNDLDWIKIVNYDKNETSYLSSTRQGAYFLNQWRHFCSEFMKPYFFIFVFTVFFKNILSYFCIILVFSAFLLGFVPLIWEPSSLKERKVLSCFEKTGNNNEKLSFLNKCWCFNKKRQRAEQHTCFVLPLSQC